MVPRMCHRVSSSPCITLPRAMLPRSSSCFRALHGATRGGTLRCLRLSFRVVLCVSAQFLVLPRTQWCHARLYNPMSHLCRRAVLRVAAQFHVQPRTPWCHARRNGLSSTCCLSFLRSAAQSHVLPRAPWCHARQNASSSSPVFPRINTCCRAVLRVAAHLWCPRTYGARAPMVPAHLWCHARKNASSSSPVLPHSSLDCYKKKRPV